MDYVTSMDFEDAADFNMLKTLILDAASDRNLNIFDNVFDWSIMLTKAKIASEPKGSLKGSRKPLVFHNNSSLSESFERDFEYASNQEKLA